MYDDATVRTDEFTLLPHPDCPPPEGVSFSVRAGRRGGCLFLHFRQFGDVDDRLIRFEPRGHGGRTDGLWEHTCFEAFVRVGDTTRYVELNFSSWGEWAAYAFEDRRLNRQDVVTDAEEIARLAYKGDPGDGTYDRLYETSDLFDPDQDWQLGLSAVVEATDGTKSYWALAHAPGPPDFHNPATFIATLSPPR